MNQIAEENSTIILTSPAPMSSVQIEQAAKGPPRATVKVYATTADEAAEIAARIYDQLTLRYREEAQP